MTPSDRQLIAGWAEHGVPADASTLEHAGKVLARLLDELDVWSGIVDQLLAHCRCEARDEAASAQMGLFDGDMTVVAADG